MSLLSLFNFGRRSAQPPMEGRTEYVTTQPVLRRVLSFTGHTIHDVINDPIARQKVAGYYKLHRWVERESEIGELERQWNSLTL
jgi:hypothetical protein